MNIWKTAVASLLFLNLSAAFGADEPVLTTPVDASQEHEDAKAFNQEIDDAAAVKVEGENAERAAKNAPAKKPLVAIKSAKAKPPKPSKVQKKRTGKAREKKDGADGK